MSRKKTIEKQNARQKIGLLKDFVDIKDPSKDPGLDYI